MMRAVTPWLKQTALAVRAANRRRLERRHAHKGLTYADWVRAHDTLSPQVVQAMQERMGQLPSRPVISVLMPVFNTDPEWLRQAIESVHRQIYPHWELCIADDKSSDPAVRVVLEEAVARDARVRVCWRAENGHISRASNSALEMARGDYVALLDHDDVLPPHALLINAETIAHNPRAGLLYSDEDVLRFDGQRQSPNFKPDWNPELFRSQNMVCHLGVYATSLLRRIGGFRTGYEGAQDYDVALRCVEHLEEDQIIHIPHVLYHWRQHPGSSAAGDEVKPYITEAGQRALQEHLQRTGLEADVMPCPGGGYRVIPALPSPRPSISVIVLPTHDAGSLRRCVARLLDDSAAVAWELLVCTGAALDASAQAWLEALAASGAVKVLHQRDQDAPALVLQGASQARGEFLCLLAADIEFAGPDCLPEMIGLATVRGTGAVGAKLLRPDGSLAHGGFIVGAGQGAAPLHPGLAAGQHGYRSRAVLNQNVAAVSSACMVMRRSLFLALDGFDARFTSGLRDVDLCLRLRERGLRTVWAAHVRVVRHGKSSSEAWPQEDLAALQERWGDALQDDPAYNPNLDLETAEFRLAPIPRVTLKLAWFARRAVLASGHRTCAMGASPPPRIEPTTPSRPGP